MFTWFFIGLILVVHYVGNTFGLIYSEFKWKAVEVFFVTIFIGFVCTFLYFSYKTISR